MAQRWPTAMLLSIISAASLIAQGTKVRESVAAYPAQAQIGDVGIGADLIGHYLPLPHTTLYSNSYLVVEVALFAPPTEKVNISNGQFVLNINGRRLMPQSPGFVTLAYTVPDMRERTPHLEAGGGVGGVTIGTGANPTAPKFPGDPNPADYPRVPSRPPQSTPGDEESENADPRKAILEVALPEGAHATPISGYLFYSFEGKLKRIKHAELEYSSSHGSASLALR
jgi:hypothetical protein